MRYLNLLLRPSLALLAAIAGCVSVGRSMYGVWEPPTHSDVTIEEFSYTPASPIHVGDSLTFSARLTKPSTLASINVLVGSPPANELNLHDDGLAPDTLAQDGIYSGTLQWTAALGTGPQDAPEAFLHWTDSTATGYGLAAPFTVEP